MEQIARTPYEDTPIASIIAYSDAHLVHLPLPFLIFHLFLGPFLPIPLSLGFFRVWRIEPCRDERDELGERGIVLFERSQQLIARGDCHLTNPLAPNTKVTGCRRGMTVESDPKESQ